MNNWKSLIVSLWCGKYHLNESNSESVVYRTFGNHDIIVIKPFDQSSASDVLNRMWETTYCYSKSIKAGESIHNLFAFTDDECISFWECSSPYLFVSSIQIKYSFKDDFEKQLITQKEEIDRIFKNYGFIKNSNYAIYNSLDSSDLLLFFKTEKYTLGAKIINEITIKTTVKNYGYSFCGFDPLLLSAAVKNQEEIIPKVVICSALSDASNYEDWFNAFTTEYPYSLNERIFNNVVDYINTNTECYDEYVHLARLGNEDICINIYNCRVSHFLRMLCDDNGVFSNKNTLTISAFSRLRIQFDSEISDLSPAEKRGYIEGISIIKNASNTWKTLLEKNSSAHVYKAISEILAASENLEIKEFAFDVLDCIRNVFPLFMKKIQEYSSDSISKFSHRQFDKDLIHFASGLMSIANGSLHADKLFINVPGFNAVPCDAPSKLLSYYTSYIQKLVCVLNDTEKFDYRFILCPDLYLGIEVVKLFSYKSEDSQLLKARIPIKKLFEPKELLMELSHEVAHFVGIKIRDRIDRVNYLSEIIAYEYSELLLRPIELIQSDDMNTYSSSLETDILLFFNPELKSNKTIFDMLCDEWKDIFDFIKLSLSDNIGCIENKELFLEDLKVDLINNSVALLVDNHSEKLKNKALDVIVQHKDKSTSVDDSDDNAFLLYRILERHIDEIILCSINEIIDAACNLCSESFADLVMLYITKDPQTYLYNIFETEKNASFLLEDKLVYPWEVSISGMKAERIVSVLKALGYKIKDIDNKKDDLFKEFLNELSYYENSDCIRIKSCSVGIINANCQYLLRCLDMLKSKGKEFEKIEQLFMSTVNNNIKDCMDLFRECNFAFRKSLMVENDLV